MLKAYGSGNVLQIATSYDDEMKTKIGRYAAKKLCYNKFSNKLDITSNLI